MTSWFANIFNCWAFCSLFGSYNHNYGKNDLYYLLENVPRILKIILDFCPNLIFMDLWRHIDIMICQCTQYPSLLFNILSSYTHTIPLEVSTILKTVLEFCLNLIFMDLWRHNDVMICQCTQFPSLYFNIWSV